MSHSDRPRVHSGSTKHKNETSRTQNVTTGPQGVSTMSNPNHDQGDPSRTGGKGKAPQPSEAYPQTAPASQHHAPQGQEAYGANYQQPLTSPQPDGQPTADSGAIPKVLKSKDATRSGTAHGSTGEQPKSNMFYNESLNYKGQGNKSFRDIHPGAMPADRDSDDDNGTSNGDKYEGNIPSFQEEMPTTNEHDGTKGPQRGIEVAAQLLPTLWSSIEFKLVVQTPEDNLESKPQVDIPIQICQFIVKESSTIKKKFRDQLGGGVKIETGDGKLKLIYTGNSNIELQSIKTKAKEALKSVADEVLTMEIPVDGDNEFVAETCIKIVKREKKRQATVFYHNNKLLVVGFRPDCDHLYRALKEVLPNCGDMSDSPETYSIEESLGSVPPGLFNYVLGLLKLPYPLLDIQLDVQRQLVKFTGEKKDCIQCRDILNERLKAFKCWKYSLDGWKCSLLQLKETQDYIDNILKADSINCFYEVVEKTNINIYSDSEFDAKMAYDKINERLRVFVVSPESSHYGVIMSSKGWEEIVKSNKDKKLFEIENQSQIVYYGTRDIIERLQWLEERAKSQLSPVTQNAENSPQLHTKCIPMPISTAYLLSKYTDWGKTAQQALRDIGAEIKHDNTDQLVICIKASSQPELEQAEKIAKGILEKLQFKEIKAVSLGKAEFLNRLEVLNYVNQTLKSERLLVFWHTTTTTSKQDCTIVVCGIDQNNVNKAMNTIMQLVPSTYFTFGSIKNEQHQQLCKLEEKYKNAVMLYGNAVGGEDVEVISLHYIHEEVCKQVNFVLYRYAESDRIEEEKMYARKDKIELVLQKKKEIADEFRDDTFEMKADLGLCMLTVSGPLAVRSKVKSLLSSLSTSCVQLDSNDIQHLDKSDKAVGKVASKNECLIKREGRNVTPSLCFLDLTTKNLVVVEIFQGRPTDLEVDMVIYPTNECFLPIMEMEEILKDDKAITEAGQTYLSDRSSALQLGDTIFLDASSKYACHKIAPCVFKDKSSLGSFKSILTAIPKAIARCQSPHIQRIAIPVHIFENEDIESQADAVFSGVHLALKSNTCIKEIYLCLVEPGVLNMCCEQAKNIFKRDSFGVFDWSPINMDYSLKQRGLESSRQSSGITVSVQIGEIVYQQVDMIVNTVGRHLNLSEGAVSKSILKAAGNGIQKECSDRYPRGINIGEVIETTSGKLVNCQKICHGVLPEWIPRADFSVKVLKLFAWQCLLKADQHGFKSVAFPALGTGKLKYPHRVVAETLFQVATDFSLKQMGTSVQSVYIIAHPSDQRTVKVFKSVERKRNSASFDEKDFRVESCILESRLPSSLGSVCVQVLPYVNYNSIEEELLVQFDEKYTATMKPLENNERFVLQVGNLTDMKKVISECLFINYRERLISVAVILEGSKLRNVKHQIEHIREEILNDSDNPYLQLVRIYINDDKAYNTYLKEKSVEAKKGQEKSSSPVQLLKKALYASVLSGQKQMPQWNLVHPYNRKKQQYLMITGKEDDVTRAKKEINDILNEIKPKKVWFYVDQQGTKFPFDEHVCERLNFSNEIENETIIKIKDIENQNWEIYMKKMKCQNDYEKFELVQEWDQESSVDPEYFDSKGTSSLPNQQEIREKEPFDTVSYQVNASAQINPQMVKDLTKDKKMELNEKSMEVESSFVDMEWMNTKLKESVRGSSKISPKTSARQVTKQSFKLPDDDKSSFQDIVSMSIPFMEYKMLKFFCGDCRIFDNSQNYSGGVLSRFLLPGETEKDLKEIVQSKIQKLNTYNTQDVYTQTEISDTKWAELIREVNQISKEIFCFRSKGCKHVTLKSSQYEKLQMAKIKCEFVLGLKEQKQGRRGGRVIASEQNYKKDNESGGSEDSGAKPKFSRSLSGGSTPILSNSPDELKFTTTEGLVVRVYVGNITQLQVDCIVNAANENLSHGGGVADVISRAAGYQLQDESDDYVRNHGQLKVAECISTSAYNLPYKCIIHAVGPRWYDYPNNKQQCGLDLKKTIENCLHEANGNNMATIAIPAISSGIFGVPKEVCVWQYRQAVIDYSVANSHKTSLKEIHFMDKDPGMIRLIQEEFKTRLNMSANPSANTSQSSSSQSSRITNLSIFSSSSSNTGKDKASNFSKSYSGYGTTQTHQSNSGHGSSQRTGTESSLEHRGTQRQNSGGESNMSGTVKGGKFKKQYKTTGGVNISVIQGDLLSIEVDVIICPQDDDCLSRGRIAKAIEKTCNEEYKRAVGRMNRIRKSEVKRIDASPKSLPFKYVLHAVAPRWDKDAVKDNSKFMKDLSLTIRNIMKHCSDSKSINTVAIPILGVGVDGHETPYVTFSSTLVKEISDQSAKGLKIEELNIVVHEYSLASGIADQFDKESCFSPLTTFSRRRPNKQDGSHGDSVRGSSEGNTSVRGSSEGNKSSGGSGKLGTTVKGGNVDDCVICMEKPDDPRRLKCGHVFCHGCISQHFKINNPVCPTCGSIQGQMTGNQPPGKMKIYRKPYRLEGYPECGSIQIEYQIYSGKQGPEHKDPGRWFEEIRRTAYLPDNPEGQLVAKMLRIAFDRRLVFTIGESRTTGKTGVVTWNDIHHKTNPNPHGKFGYPDPTYLDRVTDELSVKGVTKDDVKPGMDLC